MNFTLSLSDSNRSFQCIFWSRNNLEHSLKKVLQLIFLWLYSLLVAFVLAIEVASFLYIIHHKILVVLATTRNKYKKITYNTHQCTNLETRKNAIAAINLDETLKPAIFCCDTSHLHRSPKPRQVHGFPNIHRYRIRSLSIIVYLRKFYKLDIFYITLPSFHSNGKQQI